ncbi:MAG: RidA family protein [Betaproteobacteria bacterium]|nr:RidA family protein [Betaproteobacteria bacterium]
MKKILTPSVPEPPGEIFSNCLMVGSQIFLSGATASGPDGRAIGGDSMEAQARAVMNKIRHLLEAAGATVADIVKITIYVTDISRRAELGKVRNEFFPGIKPCSTLVEVKALASPDLLIEIDAVAIGGAGKT